MTFINKKIVITIVLILAGFCYANADWTSGSLSEVSRLETLEKTQSNTKKLMSKIFDYEVSVFITANIVGDISGYKDWQVRVFEDVSDENAFIVQQNFIFATGKIVAEVVYYTNNALEVTEKTALHLAEFIRDDSVNIVRPAGIELNVNKIAYDGTLLDFTEVK